MTVPPPPAYAPPPGYPVPPPPSGRGGVATAAFWIAVGTLLLSGLLYIVQFLAITRFGAEISFTTFVTTLSSAGLSLLAVAALVLGIIAARGTRPVMSGIAIGIAGAHLVGQLMSLLTPLLLP